MGAGSCELGWMSCRSSRTARATRLKLMKLLQGASSSLSVPNKVQPVTRYGSVCSDPLIDETEPGVKSELSTACTLSIGKIGSAVEVIAPVQITVEYKVNESYFRHLPGTECALRDATEQEYCTVPSQVPRHSITYQGA